MTQQTLTLLPIETAPKDGTSVLLFEINTEREGNDRFDEIDVGSWEWIAKGYEPPGYWCSNYGRVQKPTHWLPLPLIPE